MELVTMSQVTRHPLDDSFAYDDISELIVVDVSTIDLERELHKHSHVQLLYVEKGMITFYVNDICSVVPPESAIWIPSGVKHSMTSSGTVHLHCIYIDGPLSSFPFSVSHTLKISPLTRELIIEMSKLPSHIDAHGPQARLVRTLLDQLAIAPPAPNLLAMPLNPKLRRLAQYLIANPSDRRSIPEWGREIGMSQRTLQRILLKETGMSFGRWRRQFHMLLAVQNLAKGNSVQSVGYDLGYENTSAFIDMFRKTFGKSPSKYMAELADLPSPPQDSSIIGKLAHN